MFHVLTMRKLFLHGTRSKIPQPEQNTTVCRLNTVVEGQIATSTLDRVDADKEDKTGATHANTSIFNRSERRKHPNRVKSPKENTQPTSHDNCPTLQRRAAEQCNVAKMANIIRAALMLAVRVGTQSGKTSPEEVDVCAGALPLPVGQPIARDPEGDPEKLVLFVRHLSPSQIRDQTS